MLQCHFLKWLCLIQRASFLSMAKISWQYLFESISGNMLIPRWQSRRMCTHLSCSNTKIATSCWTTVNRKMLEHAKKNPKKPTSKDKGETVMRWEEGHNHVKIKPHTCQRLLKGTNKTLWAPRPMGKEQWLTQETEPDLPMSVWRSPAEAWVSSGWLQEQGYWQQQFGETWLVGLSPLGGGHH